MKVKKHTQIIMFVGGEKKTISNIIDITEGSLCKLTTDKGVEYMINQDHVLYVIRGYSEEDIKTGLKSNLDDEIDSVSGDDKYY